MTDYGKWTEKTVAVTSLLLDPQNPRIPASGPAAMDQRALISELVEHDKVLDLAQDIVENGYAPIESLIGWVDDENKTYILEGNRRLAALKLLLSPDSAPEAKQKRIRALAKEVNQDQLRKVRVLFAPTREAAARLIMQKHTQQQIEKWSPLMQARFYRSLASSGLSVAELAHRYRTTAGEIANFLRVDTLYELARLMDLPDDVKAVVNNPRKFEVSTLRRLFDSPKTRELLGVEFDENGNITGKVRPEEFKRGFSRILTDITTNKIDTRKMNKGEDIENYLTAIKDHLPNRKHKGRFTAEDFKDKSALVAPPVGGQPPIPRNKSATSPRQSLSVIPRGVKCRVKNARIVEIFDELRRLGLEKNPNASAVLFRILLELSIGHYLERTKKIQALFAAPRNQGNKGEWFPSLREMLDSMIKDPTIITSPLARKKVNKLLSDRASPLSVDGLNAYVHNRFSPPTARELRAYWDTFEDLFALVLEEPPPNPPRQQAL